MTLPVLYETHSHTPLCKHAIGDPVEYAQVAQARGLGGLTVTCHNPMPEGFSAGVRMHQDEFEEYLDLVAQARQEFAGEVDVLLGLEADFFEGYEKWVERQLASADFHYVLGSVHPQLAEFRARYPTEDAMEMQQTYFQLLAQAAETGLFDSLAHPDLIKNEVPHDWQPEAILSDVCRALDRISATGVAMELNTSGIFKAVREMNPFPQMLREMQAREIPVTIGADAHQPQRVGDRFEIALELLEQCGFQQVSYFVNRQRIDVDLHLARKSLKPSAAKVR